MRIDQSSGATSDGGIWLQYTAHIDGEQLCVRSQVDSCYRPGPPITYVLQDMRRQLMKEIEGRLFRGVP
jgi:hypothetical protein